MVLGLYRSSFQGGKSSSNPRTSIYVAIILSNYLMSADILLELILTQSIKVTAEQLHGQHACAMLLLRVYKLTFELHLCALPIGLFIQFALEILPFFFTSEYGKVENVLKYS